MKNTQAWFSIFLIVGDRKDLQVCIDPCVSWDGCTTLHRTWSMVVMQPETRRSQECLDHTMACMFWGTGRLVDSFNYKQNAPCSGTSWGAQMAVVYCLDGMDVWLHILRKYLCTTGWMTVLPRAQDSPWQLSRVTLLGTEHQCMSWNKRRLQIQMKENINSPLNHENNLHTSQQP